MRKEYLNNRKNELLYFSSSPRSLYGKDKNRFMAVNNTCSSNQNLYCACKGKKILNILVFLICSKIIEKINRQQHRSYYNQNDEEERTSTLKQNKVITTWNFIKNPTKLLASFCPLSDANKDITTNCTT